MWRFEKTVVDNGKHLFSLEAVRVEPQKAREQRSQGKGPRAKGWRKKK